MDLIFFLSGVLVTAVFAVLISKRSSKNSSVAINSESKVTATRSEEQLENLVEALDLLPIGVVIADSKTGGRLRNNVAAAMTGVRYVDILVDQAVDEMLESIVATKSSERILEAVAGTTRYFKIRGQIIDQQKAIVTIEDITEKSRIDTVRTDFVANLSHELKTPIGAVAALADSLNGETETEVV
ncbi:MAG: hypothetical protein ACKO1E_07215, partial [Acidimicrobiaceae bacterium]